MAAATFTGFGEHAVDFYDGLGADNSKAYWTDNRDTYESDIRAPMAALLADLQPEFAEFGTAKIFRPFRDVRFSPDKTPYKTHCGAVVESGRGAGAFYVQLSSDGLLVAGGSFHMGSTQVARYREAVADDLRGERLADLVGSLAASGWDVRGQRLKTTPRGFAADHPRIELLRHKSLYVATLYEPDDVLHEPGAATRVAEGWRQVRALNEWVVDHVGPAEVAERARR